MKVFGIESKRLQHNIIDLFPGSPTVPGRSSLHGERTYIHTHAHAHTHTHTHTHTYTHTDEMMEDFSLVISI